MPSPCLLKTPLPDGTLRLQSCVWREGLSDLGEARLVLLSEKRDIAPADLLGKPVTLTLAYRDDAKRPLNGCVTHFSQGGFEGKYFVYQMTLRPWLWLLTRTADCRIFQQATVPDIVKQVFEDHPVARVQSKLFRSYRQRNYCVQYRETDFNFVARLLEQEGIYWFFEHAEGEHKLVLCDSASAHDAAPGCESLPFYGNLGQAPPELEYVSEWSLSCAVKPGKVVITDYDFERPSASLLAQQARSRSYDLSDGEVFDYPGGYNKTADGSQYAEDRLDEIQSGFEVFEAGTNAQGVRTGSLLELTRHPRDDQNAQYLVTGTTLRVQQPVHEADDTEELLQCSFGAIAASQQFRPPRRTRQPRVGGPQTATVTGPAGEEIFTDKYGRVKVQFHWDRRGGRDEKSSCWVSVAHPWAGSNFGGIHIPRIGQEVVVSFLEGDPDAPLIIGRTYNGENLPPWDLPANATQSGFLTRSSKGGAYANANAVRFEDKKGSEQLWIHAEKNQDIEVENDETHWVGHDRKKNIDHDETTHVKHDRTETVDNDETITIHHDRMERVDHDESIFIGNNRTEKVVHDEVITIGNDRTETILGSKTSTVSRTKSESVTLNSAETVGLAKELSVGGLYQVTVGAAHNTTVGAAHALEVVGRSAELIGGSKSLTVGGDHTQTVRGKQSTTVTGDRLLTVNGKSDQTVKSEHSFKAKKISIIAEDELTITVGSAKLVMKKDGSILLDGKDVDTKASGKVNVKASGDVILKGSAIKEN